MADSPFTLTLALPQMDGWLGILLIPGGETARDKAEVCGETAPHSPEAPDPLPLTRGGNEDDELCFSFISWLIFKVLSL